MKCLSNHFFLQEDPFEIVRTSKEMSGCGVSNRNNDGFNSHEKIVINVSTQWVSAVGLDGMSSEEFVSKPKKKKSCRA